MRKTPLQAQRVKPALNIVCGGGGEEPLAVQPVAGACQFGKVGAAVTHAGTGSSGKRDDGLASKIIGGHKTVHRPRGTAPPDGIVKCSQFPSCVDFTGFNCIQNCVYCYYLSFFSKIALKHRPHYFHI